MPRQRYNNRARKSVVEVPADPEQLYNMAGLKSAVRTFWHNVEFSEFIDVIKLAYSQMRNADWEIERWLPFCVFQHCMVYRLNAHIIEYQTENKNWTWPYQFFWTPPKFPLIVYEYLSTIGNAKTTYGDNFKLNIPTDAIPKPALTDPDVGPGTFGKITPENHNLYECYISPYVTRKLIEESVNGPEGTDWNPFPEGFHPAGTITKHLLGYKKRERIAPDAINQVRDITFCETDDWRGKIAFSPEIEIMVNNFLQGISDKIIVKEGFPRHRYEPNNTITYCRFKVEEYEVYSTMKRLHCNCNEGEDGETHSPGFLAINGRNPTAPGLCIIPAKEEIKKAFLEHINDNFECTGTFGNTNTRFKKYYILEEMKSALLFGVNRNVFLKNVCVLAAVETEKITHNMDFAGFIKVLKKVHWYCEEVTQRSLPFCIFQHCMVSRLNAYIMQYVNNFCPSMFFAPKFPLIVYEYLSSIGNAKTIYGDNFKLNIPTDAIPKPALADPDVGPGTFGKITPENHNLYECYISPYVTRKLIEENIKGTEGDWNPFPPGFHPVGTITENLLGYEKCTGKNPTIKLFDGIKFTDSDDPYERLGFSVDIEYAVNNYLQDISDKITVIDGFPPVNEHNTIKYFGREMPVREDFLQYNYKPGTQNYDRAPPGFIVLNRKIPQEPGLCIIPEEEEVKKAFLEHINDNFECTGIFGNALKNSNTNYLFQRTYTWATVFNNKPL